MRIRPSGFLAFVGLVLLAACAGLPPSIPYDHSITPPVQSIGILTIRPPDAPVVILASTVGQSFGLIGALVDAGMAQSRETQFKAILASHNYVAPDRLTEYLETALSQRGYQVVRISVKREKDDYLPSYSELKGADAWLDCTHFGWGYIAAGIRKSTPYRPIVALQCRLVRASDQTILMRDAITYNPPGTAHEAVTISADPTYAFVDFDALTKDPDKAVAGSDSALHSTADTVGTLLK